MIVPQPMLNETVFSWVTRYHLRVGAGAEKNTYQALFNRPKIRIHAYLPNALHRLDKKGELTVQKWLRGHTLYPLFHFFGHDITGKLSNAMLSDAGEAISHAHIPHSKLNFPYGHKICPVCAKENRNKMGFAYYDIRYQIPGVEVCPIHACYLNYTSCGDYGVGRHLTLPKDFQVIECKSSILLQFAQFCFDVFELSQAEHRLKDPSVIYRNKLFLRGYITKHQHIRMQSLIEKIADFYRDFSFENGWEGAKDFHFIGRLIWNKSQSLCHPAKHLLFAFWLFDGDASQFNAISSLNTDEISMPATVDVDGDKVALLVASGLSMGLVSLQTGKSRCYIRRRCELAGVAHQTNDNAFDGSVKQDVLIQAQLGRHRQVIADNLDIGIGYVEQVISNIAGLSQWRATLRILKRVNASAHELEQARALHPRWLRKEFKANHSKAFFCLYHHARNLLESILPVKTKPHVPPHDWSIEDERLYQAISNLKQAGNMPLTEIAQSVHDRGHLHKQLNHFPKTKTLLIELGKVTEFKNKSKKKT